MQIYKNNYLNIILIFNINIYIFKYIKIISLYKFLKSKNFNFYYKNFYKNYYYFYYQYKYYFKIIYIKNYKYIFFIIFFLKIEFFIINNNI